MELTALIMDNRSKKAKQFSLPVAPENLLAFQGFVEQGEVLNTPKGFYRKVSFE